MNALHQFSYKIALLTPIRQAELLDFLDYLLQKDKQNVVSKTKTLPTVSVWTEEDSTYLENLKDNDSAIANWQQQ